MHGAHSDPSRYALLEALVSFAATTGAAVCGEGVEDLDDLRALADLDATYAQGYALARPADAWAALSPDVAASADVREGVRVAAPPSAAARAGPARWPSWATTSPTSPVPTSWSASAAVAPPACSAPRTSR